MPGSRERPTLAGVRGELRQEIGDPHVGRGSKVDGAPRPARRPAAIRVGLVDDHARMRRAIRAMLSIEQGLEVVGEAATVAAALALVRTGAPDVLLLDLGLDDGLSLRAIPEMLAARPGLRIIVLTMHDEDSYRASALEAGASAYVLKDSPPSRLVELILEGE